MSFDEAGDSVNGMSQEDYGAAHGAALAYLNNLDGTSDEAEKTRYASGDGIEEELEDLGARRFGIRRGSEAWHTLMDLADEIKQMAQSKWGASADDGQAPLDDGQSDFDSEEDVDDYDEDEDICPGICGQPAYACTCAETESFRRHQSDPATAGSWWVA